MIFDGFKYFHSAESRKNHRAAGDAVGATAGDGIEQDVAGPLKAKRADRAFVHHGDPPRIQTIADIAPGPGY